MKFSLNYDVLFFIFFSETCFKIQIWKERNRVFSKKLAFDQMSLKQMMYAKFCDFYRKTVKINSDTSASGIKMLWKLSYVCFLRARLSKFIH